MAAGTLRYIQNKRTVKRLSTTSISLSLTRRTRLSAHDKKVRQQGETKAKGARLFMSSAVVGTLERARVTLLGWRYVQPFLHELVLRGV